MQSLVARVALWGGVLSVALAFNAPSAHADGNLQTVNHIIIVMQENHSFDNYLGALPFVPGTPYHNATGTGAKRACKPDDHTCVDGLSCKVDKKTSLLKCANSNKDDDKSKVVAFHETKFCTGPDLDHSWDGTHREASFKKPNNTLKQSPMDGFVLQNDKTEQVDKGENATEDDAMGYYTDADLPFYYGLAETFAVSDRYFASVLGQTFPNRSYFAAGTSFGHLTTSEIISIPPYKPIAGTIYDLLDANGITWTDYYADLPYSGIFVGLTNPHQHPVSTFAADAAAGNLPAVSFIDPSVFADQLINGSMYENDEHPPANIRAGQYFVSQIATALRNSPSWKDSLLIVTYDEHGGFYDHAFPPAAAQGGALTPDGIAPGQCADNSNPPASTQPGGGASCSHSSGMDAPALCPPCVGAQKTACGFTPTGPYPATCATFNQLGVRLPFIAVSPFSKPHYVSHTVGDHTSLLALIEKRFLNGSHLTARDQAASTLEDMFDFDNSPSLNATVPTAPLPTTSDPGCPFSS